MKTLNKLTSVQAFALGLAAAFVAASLHLVPAAYAQAVEVSATKNGVDFTPLANQIIGISVAVLTVLAGWIAKAGVGFLASKTKMHDTQIEELLAARVNDALLRGIDFAESWAKSQVADPNSQIKHVRIDNFFVEQAVKYAVNHIPQTLNHFGLTEVDVTRMVTARLNGIMGIPVTDGGAVPHVATQLTDGDGGGSVVTQTS